MAFDQIMHRHVFKNPDCYSKNNALQYNFAMKMLSKVSFNSKSRILDIGCGDGIITNETAKIVGEGCVIGTDISIQMIDHASKTYCNQNNIRFLQMDAANNIFRQQFDIITSFNCLHWVDNQERALLGIANAAVDGAQIVLLLSHRKSQYHLVLDKICASKKWSPFYVNYVSPRSFFDITTYENMLVKSGLSVVEIVEEEMIYFYKSSKQLKEFFNAAGAQIKLIPEQLKEDFLNDFSTEFINQVGLTDNDQIPVSFWCLQIIAKKPIAKKTISSEINTSENRTLFSKL